MLTPLESKEQQINVIEANADYFGAIAYKGYKEAKEKGTLVILRQLEQNLTTLEDWQLKFKTMSTIPLTISDWKEAGLQELLIKYNPEVSVICTFLYPNGAHASYHFTTEAPPPVLLQGLLRGNIK